MQELSWSIPVKHKDRAVDWYWAIGLISIVGAIISFVVGNNIFGIFIIMGGALLIYTNLRHGEDWTVQINEVEIIVNDLKYKTKDMKGFAIVKNNQEEDILIIHTDRFFMPMLLLHIPSSISLFDLESLVSVRIPKELLREPPANILAEKLGF